MYSKLISVCIPVLNEEENIQTAYRRICEVFQTLPGYEFEVVFTDNASTDRTFEILQKLADEDDRVRVARFSCNQGYQRSILAGNLLADGAAVIQLDCDMQDPPELIRDFIGKWEEGYDVVYGIRAHRKENVLLNIVRKAFYRILDLISDEHMPHDVGDFRLVDRKIVEVLRQIDDQNPYLRGTIARLGFRQYGIPYSRDERVAGETKFNFRRLVALAVDATVANSTLPLRMASYVGILLGLLAFGLAGWYMIARLFFGANWPSGFATLALLGLFNIAFTASLFGVYGTYLIRVSQQVKPMPIAVIEKGVRVGRIRKSARTMIIYTAEIAELETASASTEEPKKETA